MTPQTTPALPLGYRFLRSEECERMNHRQPVTLLSGIDTYAGIIKGFGDATMTVTLNSTGAEITLDLDDPDFWDDGESRDRKPPMSADGEFVAIKHTSEDRDDGPDLMVPLRASIRFERLERSNDELRVALAEVRRILTERFGTAA